jgi:small subunit ribosomal protein S20
MPIKKAAKKYLKVTQKNRSRNAIIKLKVKSVIAKAKKAILSDNKPEKLNKILKEAQRVIDRAAQKKIIKKNTAARKKRQLYNLLKESKEK